MMFGTKKKYFQKMKAKLLIIGVLVLDLGKF